jgi:hypothetical protein
MRDLLILIPTLLLSLSSTSSFAHSGQVFYFNGSYLNFTAPSKPATYRKLIEIFAKRCDPPSEDTAEYECEPIHSIFRLKTHRHALASGQQHISWSRPAEIFGNDSDLISFRDWYFQQGQSLEGIVYGKEKPLSRCSEEIIDEGKAAGLIFD